VVKIFSLLFLFVIVSSGFARVDNVDNNISAYRQAELERMHMVRKAKLLTKEYELLQNKRRSWEKRKADLIARFEEKNRVVAEMDLGHDSRYGAKLAQERRNRFYASIAQKDEKIRTGLFAIEEKLAQLKKEFQFRYAVDLTEEIFEGKKARVKDKKQKIAILDEYINYMESYQKLRQMNAKYDRTENLMQNIAKINDKEKKFEENLTKKAEVNRLKMYEYKTMAERLKEEFVNQYQVEIGDLQRAKVYLENLKRAH